jgi:hypothetical protein
LGSKLMGQISLVQEAIPFINERGSFALVSGVLKDEPMTFRHPIETAPFDGILDGIFQAPSSDLRKTVKRTRCG